jgi:hypothetical protein
MQLARQPSEQTKGLLSQVQLLRNRQFTCQAKNEATSEDSSAPAHWLVSARERANCLRGGTRKPQSLLNNNAEWK